MLSLATSEYNSSSTKIELALHPWNCAPRELPENAFEALRQWWAQRLRANHAYIADALTGRFLDAMQQCVAIDVSVAGAGDERTSIAASGVGDVRGLSRWLHELHAAHLSGTHHTDAPSALLLTAPPAAGKTTMISQAVMLALDRESGGEDGDSEFVPIVLKVQRLQLKLLEEKEAFANSWNWFDTLMRLDNPPNVYRFLRQAMMSRRALLLLDGLDEGGTNKNEIERHVTEVLAPQGHVILCTSRPAGIDESKYAGFRRLELAPLTEAQQQEALEQRLGPERAAALLPYLESHVPTETETGNRATANPDALDGGERV